MLFGLAISLITGILLQYMASYILLQTPFGEISKSRCTICGAQRVTKKAVYMTSHRLWLTKTNIVGGKKGCKHTWTSQVFYHFDGCIPSSYFLCVRISWYLFYTFILLSFLIGVGCAKKLYHHITHNKAEA